MRFQRNLYNKFVLKLCDSQLPAVAARYLGHLHVTQQVFEKQLTK